MRSRISLAALTTLCAVVAVTSGGCGYALAGRGSFLPASIKTIGVPPFQNTSQLFGAEILLTERVRGEFISRGRYEVLPGETGVDAVLRGEISSVTVAPSAFNDRQLATRYTITLTAKIEFRDLKTDKVIWQNPSLTFREEYEVSNEGLAASDVASFFGQESNALDRVATEFARSVVGSILEAF
jgi:hypothetical protein